MSLRISSRILVVGAGDTVKFFSKSGDTLLTYKHNFNDKNSSSEKVIDSMQFSKRCKYFAVLFSDKCLVLWSKCSDDSDAWQETATKNVARRSTSIAFGPSEDEMYVADKAGDLYRLAFTGIDDITSAEIIEPILGHVSMLLDVAITEKYIITADRDEKIRVTCKDRPYLIQSFCLGHTEFVCKLLPLGRDMLLSSSGDGTIRVWDLEDGKQVQCCDLLDSLTADTEKQLPTTDVEGDKPQRKIPSLLACSSDLRLLVIGYSECVNSPSVEVFCIVDSQSSPLEKSYTVTIENNKRLLDIAIDGDTLYALLQHNRNAEVVAFACSTAGYKQLQLSPAFHDSLNSINLSDDEVTRYQQLFKTTTPGTFYEVFYNKKKKQFKKAGNSAKKQKLT